MRLLTGHTMNVLLTWTLVAALAPTALAQTWDAGEERNRQKVVGLLDTATRELLLSQWEGARHTLEKAQWHLDRWAKMGLAAHAKAQPLVARKAALDQRLAAKQSSPPAGATWYVRRQGGKKKKGGTTPAKPLKFLYRAIERARPGDTIRVSGPSYGAAGAGHLALSTPHLRLLGGWTPDFGARDVASQASVVRRKPGSDSRSINSHLLSVDAAAGTVIDGFVFDASGHNRYAAGSLVPQRSPSWSLVHVKAHGRKVLIRNCVFINACGTALDLLPAKGALITVENCLFINCLTTAVSCRGPGDVVIRRCTFALLWAQRSRPGCAVQLRSEGTLALHHNLIAHADVGVRSLNNNLQITLENNVFSALTRCVLEYSAGGTTQRARLADLEDVDVEEDGNRGTDPDLSLPPAALLRYLKSSDHPGLPDPARLARLIARAEGRMPLGAKGPGSSPKAAPRADPEPPKDPFAGTGEDDPFKAPDTKDPPDKKDPPSPEPPGGSGRAQIARGPWLAPRFEWSQTWPVPQIKGVDAGARPPK